jgi:phosphoribosylamine--glycine ligase
VKVLIINMDSVGEMLPFAIRCQRAGHQVRMYLSPENHPDTGKGFKGIERIGNWLPSAKWADIVIPSGNHDFMAKLDMLRKSGINVFGPTQKSADLEIKRALGMKFFTDHDIEVPEWQQFPDLKSAEEHVRKNPERYVFKTLGDEDDKALSYVGKSPADMIARLQRWQKLGQASKGPVMLQEFIEGIELGVSRWMGKDGFIGQYNVNFEHKKLLSGDCGPNCGEAGTVMKYVAKDKLGDEVLAPLEDALVKLGHTGDIDVNCIIDENGKAWPLEFTTRLGWPAANIMWAEHKGDPVQWMADALKGEDTLEVSPAVACGIVLAQPDYPNSKLTKAELADIPVYGVTSENKKYIHPQSIAIQSMPDMDGDKVVNRDIWTTTGDYLAVVTGMGKTVSRACERAYTTLKELHVPNLMYRDDVGEKLRESLPKLHALGYATEFEYE